MDAGRRWKRHRSITEGTSIASTPGPPETDAASPTAPWRGAPASAHAQIYRSSYSTPISSNNRC